VRTQQLTVAANGSPFNQRVVTAAVLLKSHRPVAPSPRRTERSAAAPVFAARRPEHRRE